MIIRTLRAAVRHPAPIGCRAGRRCAGGSPALAPLDPWPPWLPSTPGRPGSPPPTAAAAAAAAAPTRGAAAAKALASLEMAPDHLEGRADPGAGPPERTAPDPGPALTRPIPCAWGGAGPGGLSEHFTSFLSARTGWNSRCSTAIQQSRGYWHERCMMDIYKRLRYLKQIDVLTSESHIWISTKIYVINRYLWT